MLKRALAKANSLVFELGKDRKRDAVDKRVPVYEQVIATLTSGNATGVTSHPWRAVDVFKVLDAYGPKSIVELGGGSSTALFSHYVGLVADATLLSVDESREWGALTQSALEKVGLLPNDRIKLTTASRLESEAGSYYEIDLPTQIDLLYIDGPSVKKAPDGSKLANQDIVRLLDRGCRPRIIMIDGRHATADIVRNHAAGREYRFIPGSEYIIARAPGMVGSMGQFHRHCVFILKT